MILFSVSYSFSYYIKKNRRARVFYLDFFFPIWCFRIEPKIMSDVSWINIDVIIIYSMEISARTSTSTTISAQINKLDGVVCGLLNVKLD